MSSPNMFYTAPGNPDLPGGSGAPLSPQPSTALTQALATAFYGPYSALFIALTVSDLANQILDRARQSRSYRWFRRSSPPSI